VTLLGSISSGHVLSSSERARRFTRRPAIAWVMLAIFLVLLWDIPYPFSLAATDEGGSLDAALNDVVSVRGVLLVVAWASFGLLTGLQMCQNGRVGFLRVLIGSPAGVLWLLFILSQAISVLFSPSPLLCAFRVFQTIVLNGFLIYQFYQKDSGAGPLLIGSFACFCAVNSAYNLAMFIGYPDAVMSRSPVDGDRLVGGWLFQRDYSVSALFLYIYCLASLAYTAERRWIYMAGIAVGIPEIVLGATRGTAFCATAVTCLIPVIRSRSLFLRGVMAIALVVVLTTVFTYADDINTILGRGAQSLEGLDGRSDIWGTYLDDFVREGNMAFGLGFLTGGRFLASQYPDNPFGNLHNMYLEALVDLGVVGLFALVASLMTLLSSVRLLDLRMRAGGLAARPTECRDLAFCWLSIVFTAVLGLTGNLLMEDNSVAFSIPVAYLLVAMRFMRAGRDAGGLAGKPHIGNGVKDPRAWSKAAARPARVRGASHR
jgi:hypothetical protein